MGFGNHSELKMGEKMSESVEAVETQLRELRERFQPIEKAEIKRMLKLKRSVLGSRKSHEGDDPDKLYFWDWSFYDQMLRKEKYAVNTGKISEYFEVIHTLTGMLSIFEKLFGIHFKQTEASVWQKEVTLCTVWDSDSQGGQVLGYLYFDLFARRKVRGRTSHYDRARLYGWTRHPPSRSRCSRLQFSQASRRPTNAFGDE